MKMSESIKEIAAVLPKVQAEIKGAVKDATNPHFRSKYADLTSVIDACKAALNKHGITFLQPVTAGESGVVVETVLLHSSGEWISDSLALPVSKNDAQGVGSAITYGRRYGLQSMVGIPAEDDDGNAAVKSPAQPAKVVGTINVSEQAYLKMTLEEQQFCDGEAKKLIAAGQSMDMMDLAAFYNLQHYDDEEMLAINWCLREHPPVRRKIKDGRDTIRSKAIGASMATQA